jgi:hypothetical protein
VSLLLDEHFSPTISDQLRRRKHDVAAAQERPDLQGMTERQLLDVARDERRAIVTENVSDFVELHREAVLRDQPHYGLVFTSPRQFPRNRLAIGHLVRALDHLLAEHPGADALLSQTWWLEPVERRSGS